MSYEVGKRALDWLIENSGTRRNLEVDFFGGEPLLNFDVVKQLVAYGRSQEKDTRQEFPLYAYDQRHAPRRRGDRIRQQRNEQCRDKSGRQEKYKRQGREGLTETRARTI